MKSARRQAADFEQLEPEGLDLGEHAVKRGAVRQRSRQHGVRAAHLGSESGERQAHHLAEVAAYPDLVPPGLWRASRAADVITSHETSQLVTVVPLSRGSWKGSSCYGEL